MLSSELLRG